MRKDSLLQCMHEAAAQHRTPLISPISLQSKTKLGFNFVEPLWYGRSWPRSQSERGKSTLEWKKNTFIPSNYNELVDFLSLGMETPCGSPATKSFMISSLKRAESDRIWLSGEAAMAGRENQGDLWDQTMGHDLQPPIECADSRTLSLASVQNLRSLIARLMKLALDWAWTGEWGTMSLKRGFVSSNWLIRDWEGLVELSTEMIQ